jgi:4-diphosphocytidyl-2-C-methyl-D-erythritol kinase
MPMNPLQWRTPAKINTVLHILRKREDGFHEIYTHLVPVSLYDEITLSESASQAFQFTCSEAELAHAENLAVRVVRKFEQATQLTVSLHLHLHKNIPAGAGLGGGSSNAAAVLRALNYWYDLPLNEGQLAQIAAELGSDVPFFLSPRPTEASGRGEILTPLETFPHVEILLCKPAFNSSTSEAYQNCTPRHQEPPAAPTCHEELADQVGNQFSESLFLRHPELPRLCDLLREHGAFAAGVTGSGSAIFGLFAEVLTRNRALVDLLPLTEATLFPCHVLAEHRFHE